MVRESEPLIEVVPDEILALPVEELALDYEARQAKNVQRETRFTAHSGIRCTSFLQEAKRVSVTRLERTMGLKKVDPAIDPKTQEFLFDRYEHEETVIEVEDIVDVVELVLDEKGEKVRCPGELMINASEVHPQLTGLRRCRCTECGWFGWI